MGSFLKYTLASIVGVFIALLLLLFIFFIVAGTAISTTDKQVRVENNSFLHVKLDYAIPDRKPQNPFENFDFSSFQPIRQLGLNEILDNIEKAKQDHKIKGIYLDLSFIPANFATVEEIRNALLDFKAGGKFILAYGDFYSQKAYYLASVADGIYMNPAGMVEMRGLSKQIIFFKGTLEKLGIEPEVIRHGKFKSFVEPYTLKEMSEANKKQNTLLITSIWDHVSNGIAGKRNMDVNDLQAVTDGLLTVEDPANAVKYKLIDSLLYKDQLIDKLKGLMQVENEKDLNPVSMFDYALVPGKKEYKGIPRKKVAVIFAEGQIGMGRQGGNEMINAASLSKTIRKARKDTAIKAIVFRINSPGGSALASEMIWREIHLASGTKPVIASMGDVAASGGYYAASAADSILASPSTITGSIGVFGLLFNAREFMNDKLGITSDLVKTNDMADLGNPFRDMTPAEKAVLQKAVEKTYDTFVSHVAEGRNMSKEAVDEIGQGRVWSGTDAKSIGLIDGFGGLNEAVDMAVEKARLTKYRVVYLPKKKKPIEILMEGFKSDIRQAMLKKELGIHYEHYVRFKSLPGTDKIMARLPYHITIN